MSWRARALTLPDLRKLPTIVASLLVAACTPRGGIPNAPTRSSSPTPSVVAEPGHAAGTDPATNPPLDSPSIERTRLDRLRSTLVDLEHGPPPRRPARIVWLGDSHTAADFWTGEVRRLLQDRFGDGGPGFVPVGLSGVRHEGARVRTFGSWRQEPRVAASSERQLDGKFGLAGRRAVGDSGDGAHVNVLGPQRSLAWTVHFTASDNARFVLETDGGRIDATQAPMLDPQSGWRVATATSADGFFRLEVAAGEVGLLGVFAETSPPGLVLDALGINGARLSTWLAWDEQDWGAHLRARDPDLVVVAYGTNEAGDRSDVNRYYDGYERVVDHIRSTRAVCLLIGPTDRQDKTGQSLPRVGELDIFLRQAAERLDCLYFSAYQAMGGTGSFGQWRAHSPPLASRDGVHLTVSGYRTLAAHFVTFLMDAVGLYRRHSDG